MWENRTLLPLALSVMLLLLLSSLSPLWPQEASSATNPQETSEQLLLRWSKVNALLQSLDDSNKKQESWLQDSLKLLAQNKESLSAQREELLQLKNSYDEAVKEKQRIETQLLLLKEDLRKATESGKLSMEQSRNLLEKLEETERSYMTLASNFRKLEGSIKKLKRDIEFWQFVAGAEAVVIVVLSAISIVAVIF